MVVLIIQMFFVFTFYSVFPPVFMGFWENLLLPIRLCSPAPPPGTNQPHRLLQSHHENITLMFITVIEHYALSF